MTLILALLMLVGPPRPPAFYRYVEVSWFADRVGCRDNALDPRAFYFAHRELAFGAEARFVGAAGAARAQKRDYGPHPRTGLAWDLSPALFAAVVGDTVQGRGRCWVLVENMAR